MIRETGSSSVRNGTCTITIEGTSDECDAIRAMLLGACWVRRAESGGIERFERFEPLPGPVEDPARPDAWQTDFHGPGRRNDWSVMPLGEPSGWHSPGIYVSHLCGYGYTVENYKRVSGTLHSYGFECMRSRRGLNGKFWEVWYLPFFEAASGELKTFLESAGVVKQEWAAKAHSAVGFLCRTVSFGSCDVTIQRAAMVLDPE